MRERRPLITGRGKPWRVIQRRPQAAPEMPACVAKFASAR